MCIRDRPPEPPLTAEEAEIEELGAETTEPYGSEDATPDLSCLLYTSDAADERSSVDLGGRRIIKKKNTKPPRD